MAHISHSITLLATPETTCDYLPQEQSVTRFVHPDTPMNPVLYGALMEEGFRRSGGLVYQHVCPACHQCQSLKLDPMVFRPSRSQRRCLKSNEDVSVIPRKAKYREEYFALYQRYIDSRHGDGSMASPTPEAFSDFLIADWCSTWFVEMRKEEKLLGVAVVDRVPRGLSAVYTFYEPDENSRGLGNFAVLWQLELARKRRMPWVYLGYWIKGHQKMDYKSRFRPAQVFRGDRWHPLDLSE